MAHVIFGTPKCQRGPRQAVGAMTPVGSLMGHLVYGIVLGLTYSAWPLT